MLDELLHSALHCTHTLYNTYRAYIPTLVVHNNHNIFHYAAASQALSNIEVDSSWVEVGHNCGFVLHLTSTFNQSSIIHSSLLHCSRTHSCYFLAVGICVHTALLHLAVVIGTKMRAHVSDFLLRCVNSTFEDCGNFA